MQPEKYVLKILAKWSLNVWKTWTLMFVDLFSQQLLIESLLRAWLGTVCWDDQREQANQALNSRSCVPVEEVEKGGESSRISKISWELTLELKLEG
jgi:hypothetical protein